MHEKKKMFMRFDKNYKKIKKNSFYKELPRKLQKTIMQTVTAHELQQFTYLFQDFGISGL